MGNLSMLGTTALLDYEGSKIMFPMKPQLEKKWKVEFGGCGGHYGPRGLRGLIL
jgi:hypothetical protein